MSGAVVSGAAAQLQQTMFDHDLQCACTVSARFPITPWVSGRCSGFSLRLTDMMVD